MTNSHIGSERRQWMLGMREVLSNALLQDLSGEEAAKLARHWPFWARPEQLAPEGNWRVWLICAGRGFGKTRTGAEWVRQIAHHLPDARIALVASSLAEARAVMVEGESGLLACCRTDRLKAEFEPSRRLVQWANGAAAMLYSAAEPESLRGPQHSHAWCDEIAKWDNASGRAIDAWDNLEMGLRLGDQPQALATTTPRAVPLMRRLMADDQVAITRGRTQDNTAHLPAHYLAAMARQYGKSALGRQELDGELLTDIEGALWNRSMIETSRIAMAAAPLVRVVVAVDPPASARGDECGIVVAGRDAAGTAYILADTSVARPSPERWARAVATTALEWSADRVVAEANQGGDMVANVLRAADCVMPIKLVHATRGKTVRAEPVAALYEAGRVRHVGQFAQLEDQLCGLMTGGDYTGPGRSPDRADALIWALTELMLGQRGAPRVQSLD